MSTILIVDDETNIHYSFEKILPNDIEILSACDGEDALEKINKFRPNLVVMDVQLPGMSGLDALQKIKEIDAKIPVIIMTAYGSVNTAINAMKFGAYEYILKPFDVEKMRGLINGALANEKIMRRSVSLPSDFGVIENKGDVIIGSSDSMQKIYKLIGQVAEQDVTVLIFGESGTGKELIARAIYHHSKRNNQPFLEVNCAALPESLLETELFGHEKGAFTGAIERHIGKFEQVNLGTMFLDEIGEMSLNTQAKVLRVIQSGEFIRVGGQKMIHSNVRLIVATNRNLEQEIKLGNFREDLFYRLNVITFYVPPLRKRKSDIPELVHYFVQRFNREMNKKIRDIDKNALQTLIKYHWPGNVRQLENCIRRAIVLSKGVTITSDELEFDSVFDIEWVSKNKDIEEIVENIIENYGNGNEAPKLVPTIEKLLISKALLKTRGNQVQAAKMLGIHRNTLRSRMKKYQL